MPKPAASSMAMADMSGMNHGSAGMAGMTGMDHGPAAPAPAAHKMAGMSMAGMDHGGMDHSAMGHKSTPAAGVAMAGMDMGAGPRVSGLRKAVVTLLTLLMLAVGYWLAGRYGDLSMRPGEPMAPMPGMNIANGRM